ncbi:MAG TPA: M3 family oligoendopeptidase [Chitinophagales bacterium]|jgi:oligoendopeptidase F|nr:M3 family oligoendopeptidase [Chitinophagales bacterium]
MTTKEVKRRERHFLPQDLVIREWSDIGPFYTALAERAIASADELLRWIADRSETDAVLDEEYRWRYIRQTCDTDDEAYKKAYEDFIEHMMPNWMTVMNQLNKKLAESPFMKELDQDRFFVYFRSLKSQLDLFREENIPITQQIQLLSQEYGSTIGAMTIEHEGTEYTLPQAAVLLQREDRTLRKEVFEKINNRRQKDRQSLNDLFSKLIQLRHTMALNAGFSNYRDYMFAEMGRFDYDVAACEQFHEAIKTEVLPLVKKILEKRKSDLQLDTLRPYDLEVETSGHAPLKPFTTDEELVEKSVQCLRQADPFFAECISIMNDMQFLDLNSRKGKAPGGYNMTLPEIGVPFIFMNAAGTQRDVETMVHEAGHAVHSFLMRTLPYNFDQEITSEIAELASMSMELMTFDGLSAFYSEEDKKRAIQTHLEGIVLILPWIAIIDKFQHWIYLNPNHTVEEREQKWLEIHQWLSAEVTDWSGYEEYRKALWQKQLHLFEVPFYYIEYGIAQLGAISVWKNYKQDKTAAIQSYKNALSLGYTKPIPEVYKTAGVAFNFSRSYVHDLMQFLQQELDKMA